MSVIPQSAYTVVKPSQSGDLVGLRLDNLTGSAEPSRTISFGQAFASGDLPSGAGLVARIGGQLVPLQVDVKTTNADGSARFAVLTLDAPSIPAGGKVDVMLAKGTPPAAPAAVSLANALTKGFDLKVKVDLHNSDGSVSHLTADAASALRQALSAGTADYWLKGPLATEARVTVQLNSQITAAFDIRMDNDGNIRTDVQMHYDWAYKTPMKNVVYDVQITQAGKVAYSKSNLTHFHHADWHKQIWSAAGAPDAHIVRDIGYLEKSGAVPLLDMGLAHQDNLYVAQYDAMTAGKVNTGPMGPAFVRQYMPDVGNRADIGPIPSWAAQYLVSQDAKAYAVMMANANAAGSIPWHFRSETTGRPVTIDEHPKLWIDARGVRTAYGVDALKQPYETKTTTGWTPDQAHQPSLSYVPFLVTGDRYYLDELQAQASYALAGMSPDAGYRNGANGWVDEQQVRGAAWVMRTLGDVSYITPDKDPLKSYFTAKLNGNLTHMADKYITGGKMDSSGSLEGFLRNNDGVDVLKAVPWQDDYFTQVLGYLGQRGYTKAVDMMNWKANYEVGRFISKDLGFDPYYGVDYKPTIRSGSTSSPGAYFTTWKQYFDANYAGKGARTEFLPETLGYGGYAPNAFAALANLVTNTKSPDAIEAFGFVAHVLNINSTMNNQYSLDPKFSIAPRLPDGEILHRDHIKISTATGASTMNAGPGDNLLYGGTGNDTITGGAKMDLLFGNSGADSIHGGDGKDYIYGGDGDGNDILFGDAGNDVLRGGPGTDTLTGGDGNDTLYFDAQDILKGGPGFDTLAVQAWRPGSMTLASTKITGIEHIVLNNGQTDTVTLTTADILRVSDTKTLYIEGETRDNVAVGGGLSRGSDITLDGVRYAHYTGGGANLNIEVGMKLNGTAIASGTLASGGQAVALPVAEPAPATDAAAPIQPTPAEPTPTVPVETKPTLPTDDGDFLYGHGDTAVPNAPDPHELHDRITAHVGETVKELRAAVDAWLHDHGPTLDHGASQIHDLHKAIAAKDIWLS